MPDLLTHVLCAYVLATVVTWRTDRLAARHVPIVMIGGALPDLSKLYLVVDAEVLESLLGVPFSWEGAHTLGVVVVLSVAGTQLFERGERRTAFCSLVAGFVLHFGLDSFIVRADGLVPPYLFPITWWQYPSGDLYLSSTLWPSVVAVAAAVLVLGYDRTFRGNG